MPNDHGPPQAAARNARAGVGTHQFSGPLYEQVRGLILSRIEAGHWGAGAPIPAEVQLSRDFGVSIGTVRKALDQLARDRVLVRERGRGTFVKHLPGRRAGLVPQLCDADGEPVRATIALIAAEYAIATAAEIATLKMLRPASIVPRALKLRREWRRNGHLICLETITVDAARFPNLQFEADLQADVLFQVYAHKYGAPVDRTTWTARQVPADDPDVSGLREGRSLAVIHFQRTAFDAKDLPLEICAQKLILDRDLMMRAGE